MRAASLKKITAKEDNAKKSKPPESKNKVYSAKKQ